MSICLFVYVFVFLPFVTLGDDFIDKLILSEQPFDDEYKEILQKEEEEERTADEFSLWASEAVLDVAFYLRAHKFNEFDRRYYLERNENNSYFYAQFPIPPLVTFHWEAFKMCSTNVFSCLKYLQDVISESNFQRDSSTNHVVRQMNWTMEDHKEYIQIVDKECLRLKDLDFIRPEPFRGPLDRFRWRVTASYFMCWYTMQNITLLAKFNEPCDDIGECYQTNAHPDFRSDNTTPYQCALYSFCPDPCCPVRHASHPSECEDLDPCRDASETVYNNKCTFHRHENGYLPSVVYNEWNVSCICDSGYMWDSRYGTCIDVNECAVGSQKCNYRSETCINLPGSYRCICRWGFMWSEDKQTCVSDMSIKKAEIRFGLRNMPNTKSSKTFSIITWVWTHMKNIWYKYILN